MKLLAPGQLVKINNPDRKGCHNRIGMIISYHIKTDEPPKMKRLSKYDKPFQKGDLIIWEDGVKWLILFSELSRIDTNHFNYFDLSNNDYRESYWCIGALAWLYCN